MTGFVCFGNGTINERKSLQHTVLASSITSKIFRVLMWVMRPFFFVRTNPEPAREKALRFITLFDLWRTVSNQALQLMKSNMTRISIPLLTAMLLVLSQGWHLGSPSMTRRQLIERASLFSVVSPVALISPVSWASEDSFPSDATKKGMDEKDASAALRKAKLQAEKQREKEERERERIAQQTKARLAAGRIGTI